MSHKVTLELPEDLAQRIRSAAAQSRRIFEDQLVEYIQRGAAGLPVESLSDAEVLALADSEMAAGEQAELDELQDKEREGQLMGEDRPRLDELLHTYRQGLIRKAQAVRVAVQRGLRPRPQ
jgi:hypothetical protein